MNRLEHVLNHLDETKQREPTLSSVSCAGKRYRYTLDNDILTQEQRDFYEENGFLVIRKLLNHRDCQKFYQRFDDLVADPSLRRPEMIVMRDVVEDNTTKSSSHIVTKLQMWARDPVLWEYAGHPAISRFTPAFTGNDIRAMHFMVINKPPDKGSLSSRHPLHQDLWYFPYGPADRIVCSWTALEHVHRRNGCLCVVPGSHKNPPMGRLVPHGYPSTWDNKVNKAYHAVQVDDVNNLIRERIHLEMEEGDTVFFHPLLVHGSGANLTRGSRRSISVHYASSTLCNYIPGHIPEQEVIAKEVEGMSARKGRKLTFQQIWQFKSRQVTGDTGQLGHNIPEEVLLKVMEGTKQR